MQSPQQKSDRKPRFFENFALGLKVLASELKWLGISLVHRWELSQMRKRLDEEYETLGGLKERRKSSDDPSLAEDIELSTRQIDFLKQEIDHLGEENERSRADYVDCRLEKWGMKG
jgi:hypothetical protein